MAVPKNGLLSVLAHRHRCTCCAAVIVLIGMVSVLAAGPVLAERDDSSETDSIHVTDMRGQLQFLSLFDWRKTETRHERSFLRYGRDHQTNKEFRFEETLGLSVQGDYLYPEFLTFDMRVRLGLEQVSYSEDGFAGHQRDNDTGWITDYDGRFELFPEKPVSLSAYISRKDERISRQFLPSLRHEMSVAGTTLRWNDEKWPMELTLESSRDDYTGVGDEFDDEHYENTFLRYSGTLNFDAHHRLQIDAERRRIEERYSGSNIEFNTTRTILTLDDRIEFGSNHQHAFETTLEYEEDQGDLPRDHLSIVPQLTLKHSDSFSTRYRYEFLRESYQYLLMRSHRFDVEGTHKLGDFLTTTGNAYVGWDTSNDGRDAHQYGASVRWHYRKPNRWGTFFAGLGYEYDYTRIGYDRGFAHVVDETVFFRGSLPSYLAQANVMPGTIIVTNTARTRVFVPGRDYTVSIRSDRTALSRLYTGRIDENESVLVRYRYNTSRKTTAHTHSFDLRVQQEFRCGLTPYYAANVRVEDLASSGRFNTAANELNRHRLGFTFRKSRWSVGGELEFNDETVDPYNAIHGNFDFAILQGFPDQLDFRTGGSQFWFHEFERRRTSMFDVSLNYRRAVNSRTTITGRTRYRYEHDSIQGETHGIDLTGGLEYRIGFLTVICDVEYDKLSIANANDDGVSVWLKVQREFPDLLGRSR